MTNPRWLPSGWELPQSVLSRLGRKAGRQRTVAEDGHLLIILHATPQPGQDDREARTFWRSPDGDWKASKGKGLKALVEHLSEYQAALDALEVDENKASSAEDFFDLLERSNPLARSSRNLHSTLQSARELAPDDHNLISCRDEAYGIERQAELLVQDIKNHFELYVAKKTEKMTQDSHTMAVQGHRLNTLVALFFPTATLAALLGMNVPSGLEGVAPPLAFLGTLAVGSALGYAVKSWLGRQVTDS